MTQTYIGCKQVLAWEAEKNGQPGYAIRYPDGYQSWSPKATFEDAYLPMGEANDGSRITQAMVDGFLNGYTVRSEGKTTIVHARLRNGFEMVEASSCVDPANYDEAIGADICLQRIKDRIWHLLGFALQWARAGVNGTHEAP